MKAEKRIDGQRSARRLDWLTRIDPITKGIWLLSTGFASMMTVSAAGQALWLLSILVIAGTGADWSMRRWKLVLGWCAGFGLPLVIFQWLVLPGQTPMFGSGRWLTEEAFVMSITLTCRALVMFLSSIVFATTTEPRDVIAALVGKLRVPAKFAYAAAIALRFVPLLTREVEQVRQAQKLRALTRSTGMKARIKRSAALMLAVVHAALREVQTVTTAMEAKQFGKGERTQWRKLSITHAGKLLACCSLGAAAASIWYF
ncbi:energy-coupling factor transporter transmembrane component T family protein [Paenibacillus sp. 1001270B_150601_E10]|uniref:energy-coupling factor transporter transmembrane component T family protein n=1 Tax=Paenibacillus sp. 1001270B_150601_E10 TaxID=2787079 RepID=UPI00189EF3FA|nr:energy-coupling factor transporter transmembrane component T [Paenibacillus sp. 1001270B_150601_E10]